MDQTRDSFFFQSIPHIGYWGLTKSDVFKAPTTSKNIDWFVPASFPFCSWNLKTWRYFKKLFLPFYLLLKKYRFQLSNGKVLFCDRQRCSERSDCVKRSCNKANFYCAFCYRKCMIQLRFWQVISQVTTISSTFHQFWNFL